MSILRERKTWEATFSFLCPSRLIFEVSIYYIIERGDVIVFGLVYQSQLFLLHDNKLTTDINILQSTKRITSY